MYNAIHKVKLTHFLGRNLLTENFLPFKVFYSLFKRLNWSKQVQRNGNSFTLLIKDGMGVMNFISEYEIWLDEILPKLIDKEGAVFIDVGANTGQTLLKVLPKFPGIKYFAIEPNANCVRYLQALIEVNNFSSVKILEYALSDTEGKGELLLRYQDDILATTSHSFRKFTKYSSKQPIRTISGDSLLKEENLCEVTVIKLDIEGGEAKAIDGLLGTIKTFRPYIICEIAPLPTEDKGVTLFRTNSANQILSRLSDLGYLALNITTRNQINCVEDLSSSLESCNYIFIPKEKKTIFFNQN